MTLSSYWKAMRLASRPAKMARFQNTGPSALEIIEPHLDQSLAPAICEQMIERELPIGRTGAGRVIVKKYTEAFEAMGQDQELGRMNAVMQQRFDAAAAQAKRATMELMLRDLRKLEKKQLWQAVGRHCVKIAMWGGAVLVTVATENPAAFRAAMAAAGPLEWKLKKVKKSTAERLTSKKEEIARTAVYGVLDPDALKVGVEAPRIVELDDD